MSTTETYTCRVCGDHLAGSIAPAVLVAGSIVAAIVTRTPKHGKGDAA